MCSKMDKDIEEFVPPKKVVVYRDEMPRIATRLGHCKPDSMRGQSTSEGLKADKWRQFLARVLRQSPSNATKSEPNRQRILASLTIPKGLPLAVSRKVIIQLFELVQKMEVPEKNKKISILVVTIPKQNQGKTSKRKMNEESLDDPIFESKLSFRVHEYDSKLPGTTKGQANSIVLTLSAFVNCKTSGSNSSIPPPTPVPFPPAEGPVASEPAEAVDAILFG